MPLLDVAARCRCSMPLLDAAIQCRYSMPLLDAAAARCHRDRRRRSTVARPLDRAAHRRVRASRQIALSMRLLAVHPRLPARVPCAPRACPVPFFLFVCAAACRPLVCLLRHPLPGRRNLPTLRAASSCLLNILLLGIPIQRFCTSLTLCHSLCSLMCNSHCCTQTPADYTHILGYYTHSTRIQLSR